jgi:hypothetical protein
MDAGTEDWLDQEVAGSSFADEPGLRTRSPTYCLTLEFLVRRNETAKLALPAMERTKLSEQPVVDGPPPQRHYDGAVCCGATAWP